MKKFKLELDKLVVESFDTGDARSRLGTVKGYDSTAVVDGCPDNATVNACVVTLGTIGCPNSAFPCQSDDACNTDACEMSFNAPHVCARISLPGWCTTNDKTCTASPMDPCH